MEGEDYREILDDLESQVERTEREFEEVAQGDETEKHEKAEELMQEIKGQIEFLEDLMEKQ